MTSAMDEPTVQTFARLTAHEFLLEILYAQWFAQMPESDENVVADRIRTLLKQVYIAPDADVPADDAALRLAMDSQVMGVRFLEKVKKRAGDIRRQVNSSLG